MIVQEKSKEKQHLTPRDLSILTLVMQQRAIRLDQIPHFIALIELSSDSTQEMGKKSTAHNLVERLQHAGLLHLQRFEKGQPAWVWLTKKGLHALGNTSSWKRPTRSALPLFHAINTIRLLLSKQEAQATWISHQQLRSSEAGKGFSPLPTAELLTDTGERIAIHVVFRLAGTDEQIAARMHQQMERKTSSGIQYYTELWYYTSNDVAKRLRDARARVAEIATKEQARTICIFSYPLQKHLLYRGHRSPVRTLAWSPDGTRLASAGEELHVWNATTGKEQFRLPIAALPSLVGWSSDGLWVGLGDKEGRLSFWEGTTGKGPLIALAHSDSIVGMAWSPQQNDLVATCSASGNLQLYDVRHNRVQWEASSIYGAASLAWAPDGSRLAVGGNDNIVCLFSTTGKQLRAFKKHHSACIALTWSPDSKLIASAGGDQTILIWDATTGKKQRTIRSQLSAIGVLAWSPDGTRLACAESDACVQVWSIRTGSLLQTYKDHTDTITSIAWSPDNTMLASASNDGTVHVYPTVGGAS